MSNIPGDCGLDLQFTGEKILNWRLDWGFSLQIIRFRSLHQLKLFFPLKTSSKNSISDLTVPSVQSHQWAAIDGSTCAEMFLLRIMCSHQRDGAWSHILRITPKLHNNVIQLPWKQFSSSSRNHSKAYLELLSMRGPIPELYRQNWIKPWWAQMVQMPLCHIIWSTHTGCGAETRALGLP